MYVGLGVGYAPSCDGSDERKTRVLPNIQVQWSNGVFVRNQSLGIHLSNDPGIEYGPLLEYDHGCDASPFQRSVGVKDINSSIGLGGFFNYYLAPDFRLGSKLLVGRENGRDRVLFSLDARKYVQVAAHHGLGFSAGLTWANQGYVQTRSDFDPQKLFAAFAPAPARTNYSVHAGIKDVHAGVNWNWELTPAWLVTSQASVFRLTGSAADNPLNRRSYMTVYTGLAYRF